MRIWTVSKICYFIIGSLFGFLTISGVFETLAATLPIVAKPSFPETRFAGRTRTVCPTDVGGTGAGGSAGRSQVSWISRRYRTQNCVDIVLVGL